MSSEMKPHITYPAIAKAALEIEYDNGGINCTRTEDDALRDLDDVLDDPSVVTQSLLGIDAWLASLSDEDLGTVCAGEEGEADAILASAPAGAKELLNRIFDAGAGSGDDE